MLKYLRKRGKIKVNTYLKMSLPNPPSVNSPIPNNPFHSPEVPATFDRLSGVLTPNIQLEPNPSTLGVKGWVRPADWLPMPPLLPTDEKFVGLFAVYDTPENFIAVYFEGDYTVDWGDGSVENYGSGEKAQHSFSWLNTSASTLTSSGHKQVLVTVTPQNGQNLTLMDLTVRHDNISLGDTYSTTPWLDISVSMPEADTGESLIFTKSNWPVLTTAFLSDLQELTILNSGLATEIFSSNQPLHSLKKITLNSQVLDNLGALDYFGALEEAYLDVPNLLVAPFYLDYAQNTSLRKVMLGDLLSTDSVTNFFNSCTHLEEVKIGDMPLVEDASSLFKGCYSLKEISLGQTPQLLFADYAFVECVNLKEAPFFDTSNLESFYGCFTYCDSLESIPQYDLSNVIELNETFYECYSLKNIPPFDLPSLEYVSYPFYYCSSLYSFPEVNLSENATELSSFFDRCGSLQQSGLKQVFSDINYSGCLLGRGAIVQIFNNLGEADASITVEGNYGAADLTPSDLAIATDKGWTVLY